MIILRLLAPGMELLHLVMAMSISYISPGLKCLSATRRFWVIPSHLWRLLIKAASGRATILLLSMCLLCLFLTLLQLVRSYGLERAYNTYNLVTKSESPTAESRGELTL